MRRERVKGRKEQSQALPLIYSGSVERELA